MKKINWGIIGLGNIAHEFSKAFAETNNARLLAISSKDKNKLKKFKLQYNIDSKFSFNNYQDLINCDEVDIVYIALPNSLHKQWILNAIKNKKNILVEKPATINFSEANEIKDNLKNTNIFFSEAFMYRYHPQIQSVVKIIKDNKIGNLLSMESSFGEDILTKKKLFFFMKKKKIDPKSRKFDKDLGGGCILDLGCYPSSFSLLIGSLKNKSNMNSFEIKNVLIEKGETGVDIDSVAELSFQDGFKSKIHASYKKNLGSKSLIYGEKGTILLNKSWSGGNIIIHLKRNSEQKISFANNKNIYSYQIEEISKNLIKRSNKVNFPIMSLEETLINMKIIDNWLNYCET
tara:strand:+ start:133 stop:1170 length:1038 start_codon:yes stop_codon:yes gene_type:complete